MGKIENKFEAIHGVASRFDVLQNDDWSDSGVDTNTKASSIANKTTKTKKSGGGKSGNISKQVDFDLKAAAFQTSNKTKKTKAEKKRTSTENKELEKRKAIFEKSSLSTVNATVKENYDTDSLKSTESSDSDRHYNAADNQQKAKAAIKANDVHLTDPTTRLNNKKSIKKGKQAVGKVEKLVENKTKQTVQLENTSALQNQYKLDLEKKDIEISKLKSCNETLKEKLEKNKQKYTTIRSILDESELKEKAQLVAENEKLRSVRDEMSQNILSLTKELEQYKTKTQVLNSQVRHMQGKQRYTIPG